jgi:hypothetical protein
MSQFAEMVCAMRKSQRKTGSPKKTTEPPWMSDYAALKPRPLSKVELDDLALNVKKGISDTPAWKDLVRRFGKAEAERILKLALFSRHEISGSSDN